jgi:hypothetical protein
MHDVHRITVTRSAANGSRLEGTHAERQYPVRLETDIVVTTDLRSTFSNVYGVELPDKVVRHEQTLVVTDAQV